MNLELLAFIGAIIGGIIALVIAVAKGLISFGGTSQATEDNTEAINELQEDMENKVDSEELEEQKERIGQLEMEIYNLRERISRIEGAIGER